MPVLHLYISLFILGLMAGFIQARPQDVTLPDTTLNEEQEEINGTGYSSQNKSRKEYSFQENEINEDKLNSSLQDSNSTHEITLNPLSNNANQTLQLTEENGANMPLISSEFYSDNESDSSNSRNSEDNKKYRGPWKFFWVPECGPNFLSHFLFDKKC